MENKKSLANFPAISEYNVSVPAIKIECSRTYFFHTHQPSFDYNKFYCSDIDLKNMKKADGFTRAQLRSQRQRKLRQAISHEKIAVKGCIAFWQTYSEDNSDSMPIDMKATVNAALAADKAYLEELNNEIIDDSTKEIINDSTGCCAIS